jgi:hypothetical protein
MIGNLEKFIILTSLDKIKKADAIIFLEGDGLSRVDKVVELYQQGWAPTIVFSGAADNKPYGSYPGEIVIPGLIEKGIPEKVIVWENESLHTGEQAIKIIELCRQNNWKRILLVASNHHQYRAYMTFFRELRKQSLQNTIEIINASANLSWFSENDWGTRFSLLKSEFDKMYFYSGDELGQDFLEIIDYFKWKELLL